MKRSNRAEYTAERERAIVTLYNTVRRYRRELEEQAKFTDFIGDANAETVKAYVPAQLALLQLMKEESEENDHE